MHSIILKYNIIPGDRIVEPKSAFGLIQHHAIYLGQDYYGRDWLIENKAGFGVRLVSASDFFASVIQVTRIERFIGSGFDRQQLVQRALREIGKPYNLINYNCEHFANYVQHGSPYSKQVAGGAILSLLGLFVLAAVSSK